MSSVGAAAASLDRRAASTSAAADPLPAAVRVRRPRPCMPGCDERRRRRRRPRRRPAARRRRQPCDRQQRAGSDPRRPRGRPPPRPRASTAASRAARSPATNAPDRRHGRLAAARAGRRTAARARRTGPAPGADGASSIRSEPDWVFGNAMTSRMFVWWRQQRRPAVDAERDAAVRRRAVLERLEDRAEALLHLLERVALEVEAAGEQVAAARSGPSRRRAPSR